MKYTLILKTKDSTMRVLVTGKNGSMSTAVAQWLRNKHGFEVDQVSLRGDSWKNDDFSCYDSIVHIAGVTPQNAKSEDDYRIVNTELTAKLGEKAVNDGVKQFIYISSMAVYGVETQIDSIKGMVTEKTPCKPSSAYGLSKFEAENSLHKLKPSIKNLAIIRVPSVYCKGNRAYIDQYKYLGAKLPVIPSLFNENFKSAIFLDNLCELIYLIIDSEFSGTVCPDDGEISAVDFCRAIYPDKKCSKLLGILMEIFLKNNSRIIDYYGAVYYSRELTEIFEGKYRVRSLDEAVKLTYE